MRNLLLILLFTMAISCEQKQKSDQQAEEPATDTIVPADTTIKMNINIPERWKQKAAAGIDFIATGNEPFWSIEMDEEKFIRYTTPDGVELTTPPVKAVNIDAATKLYKAETEMGKLELQIMNKVCINDMSGDSSAYTVHLTLKLKNDEKPRVLHGCGTSLKQ
ncbi:COG3650 family protein [Lacibacter sediminis]|uniref:Uncharacterized protein n=1 Tax=Lacibacter sediminis TaxID=2760713 RepID=A0A7G5XKM7_9BACT|nr:hypothetical protein [Lacibacter sediminis]QNA46030.1 hypothetical protein H4075_07560 [Lacibacter sediminis]